MRLPPLVRLLLWPVSVLYGVITRWRAALYEKGVFKQRRLDRPVISVGNLTVGGTGKTPMVIWLAERFLAQGKHVGILTRGYKGDAGSSDEVELMKCHLQGAMFGVGANRYEQGKKLEASVDLFLLDDGFQHRALARDFDIVLVTPQDANNRLLPAGRLREPVGSLRRADAVVLASGATVEAFGLEGECFDSGKSPLLAKDARSGAPGSDSRKSPLLAKPARSGAPTVSRQRLIWRVRRGIVAQNVPLRPVVFCGIARPQNFVLQLRAAQVEPAAEAFYRDHHAYSEKDVRELLALKQRSEAGGFVTTEKDAVNLGAFLSALEPLAVVPVRMELADAANALDTMLRTIEERSRNA